MKIFVIKFRSGSEMRISQHDLEPYEVAIYTDVFITASNEIRARSAVRVGYPNAEIVECVEVVGEA